MWEQRSRSRRGPAGHSRTHLCTSSTGTVPRQASLGASQLGRCWGGRLQVAPAARSCLAFGPQLLGLPGNYGFSPCSQPVRWPSSGRTQEASRGSLPPLLGPRRLVSTTARKRDWSLKPPSLPTWGSTGKIVAFWLQARPDHSDQ